MFSIVLIKVLASFNLVRIFELRDKSFCSRSFVAIKNLKSEDPLGQVPLVIWVNLLTLLDDWFDEVLPPPLPPPLFPADMFPGPTVVFPELFKAKIRYY